MSIKDKPHALYRITDSKGQVVRHAVCVIDEYGESKPRYDKQREFAELIEKYDTYNPAQAKRTSLNRIHLDRYGIAHAESIKMPAFMPELGPDAVTRREVFLNLEIQEQEQLVYELVVSTGRPLPRILQWLMVKPEEVEHITADLIEAAHAELDLRIAKKMIAHALKNESPAAQTATMFIAKVKLGWNEQGEKTAEKEAEAEKASTSLFGELNVVETNRDPTTGQTLEEPSTFKLIRGGKATG